jgi:hypothetical protein
MSAELCDVSSFITELHEQVTDDIHPAARATIDIWIRQMYDDLNDVHRIWHLMGLVREKIAFELRFRADDLETCCSDPSNFAYAFDLRRRADAMEARHA